MAITDWPADERPREKLMQKGFNIYRMLSCLLFFLGLVSQVKLRLI